VEEKESMKKTQLLGTILIVGLGNVACGPAARMVAPSDLAGKSRVLEVADRSKATGALANESFKLGDYQIVEVDRDWNSSSSFGAGAYGAGNKTTGYTFQFKAGGTTWKGTCASLAKGKSVGSISFANSTDVTCGCESGGEKVTLKVGGETEATGGTFTAGSKTYQVSGVDETDKSYFGAKPVGYRLDDGETAYAAVETMRPGRVWLHEDVSEPEAAAISCALAGMMLYIPPSDN
jgi:hypothetical protein